MRKLDILDKTLVDATSAKAKESPRLRMNHNFHPELSVSSQKLAIDWKFDLRCEQNFSKHVLYGSCLLLLSVLPLCSYI